MGQRTGLTREGVVEVATDLVETEGTSALTLSRVARELGVKPPSLYNHVDRLDDLRRDVALGATRELGNKLGRAAMGRSGRAAVIAVATEFRAFALAHPGLYELTTQARPHDAQFARAAMEATEPVIAILRGYGLHAEEAIHAARMLRAALHGFVSLEGAGGFGLEVDIDDSFSWLVEHLADTLEWRGDRGRTSPSRSNPADA
jgi:AcrR family transcriptional regulator